VTDIAFKPFGVDRNGAPLYDILNKKVSDIDVVAQKIYIRLGIPKQEWAADTSIGVALDDLAQFSAEPTAIAQLYADIILQVPKVTSVDVVEINTEVTDRNASITFNVGTAFGATTVTV